MTVAHATEPRLPALRHFNALAASLLRYILALAIHKRLCRVIPDKWTCIRLTEYLPYATCDQLNNCPD
jgi:hypothetical protein